MTRAPAKPIVALMVKLDPALYDWLDQKARELGVTKTALVVEVLEAARDHQPASWDE